MVKYLIGTLAFLISISLTGQQTCGVLVDYNFDNLSGSTCNNWGTTGYSPTTEAACVNAGNLGGGSGSSCVSGGCGTIGGCVQGTNSGVSFSVSIDATTELTGFSFSESADPTADISGGCTDPPQNFDVFISGPGGSFSSTMNNTTFGSWGSHGFGFSLQGPGTYSVSISWYNHTSVCPNNPRIYEVDCIELTGCCSNCNVTASCSSTDADCDQNNGTATAILQNAFNPVTYAWSNGASTQSVSNLAPGTYGVTITDANGCFDNCNVFIDGGVSPSLLCDKEDPSCGMTNGTASVEVFSGDMPYSYIWNTGAQTSSIFNLDPGTYSVTVTEANGCQESCQITLNNQPGPTATCSPTHPDCNQSNGSSTVNPSNGTPPYSYSWNTGATTQTINNIPEGMYSVTVTDANGCNTSCSTTLMDQNCTECNINGMIVNTICNPGLSNDPDYLTVEITAMVTNGSGSYFVSIGGYTSPIISSGQSITIDGDGVGSNPTLLADGSTAYTIRFEDNMDASCFDEEPLGPIDPCGSNCPPNNCGTVTGERTQ